MTSHKDKCRSQVPTEEYKGNHADIFGKPKKVKKNKAERDRAITLSQQRHNREVQDGKKDASYYEDHEVRVSQNPEYQKKPENSKAYKEGWKEIFDE